ncbi:MAG: cardiolipin synthase [Actinobacteria bacterium HGW-Actinobacteria-5]|nr:MAG: cardiolipin synthase [Actinobacteria bacterium HGW-Actinobacteria-5]
MQLSDLLLHGGLALDLVGLAVRIAALLWVPVNRRPSSATAWLLAIFLIPYVGVIAFLLIGNPKLPKSRRAKQRELNSRIAEITRGLPEVALAPEAGWVQQVAQLNRNLGALPLTDGNSATLIEDYGESLHEMAAEIDTATEFVLCEFYILAVDPTTTPFFDALARAVQRGVKVFVLFDHIGSRGVPHYRRTTAHLDRIGVEWRPMLPVMPLKGRYQRPDLRNHRKLLVVDGRVGFIGSQNLIDRSYNKPGNLKRGLLWQELMTRVEGPVVQALSAVFITDWYSETDELLGGRVPALAARIPEPGTGELACQIVPSGPGFDNDNNLKLFASLLYGARRRVSLTSPYFVPDESLIAAVTTAAERGVEVELFVSELGDEPMVYHAQRSYYEVMLRAGVRIYLYPAPYILHAKHFTIDDDVAVIGSSNMDMRSFGLNLEVVMMVSGRSFTDAMREVEDHYREVSRELTLEEHLRQSLPTRLLDNLARLTSALQ